MLNKYRHDQGEKAQDRPFDLPKEMPQSQIWVPSKVVGEGSLSDEPP